MDSMKKKLQNWLYLFSTMILVFGQLGITQIATAVDQADTPEEPAVYHDYKAYQNALNEYNEKYAQYEQKLDAYNQKKQARDDAQAEADRVENENAEKKTAYETALAQYQKDLAEYNSNAVEIADHKSKGQYVGPDLWGVYGHMETYLVDYAAMSQMTASGLSLSGKDLSSKIQANMAADPFGGTSETKGNVEKVISEWSNYIDFLQSIYGKVPDAIDLNTLTSYAAGGQYYDGFKGVNFYHTFTSSTGTTKDNVPATLDHPTEANIQAALTDLFAKTNGAAFDAASQNMDDNTFLVDQTMTAKWTSALAEAKSQSASLDSDAINQYIAAFVAYNNSNHETSDYDQLMTAILAANDTEMKAFNLIGGPLDASLTDHDNSAPFYNDLKNLSATELANKYGYLILLSNMANEAVYGYFHLLTPQAGETIAAATASSWSVSHHVWGKIQADYTPATTAPTEPVAPVYENVPTVPEAPVAPVAPVKPVYEAQNTISLLKVDKENQTPLANAQFELSNSDTGEKLGTFTSGNDGLATIQNLEPGNYALVEITAPDGYVLDATPVNFIVKGTANENIQLEKQNAPVTGSVELTKTDEKTGEALQGATFEIRDDTGNILRAGLQTNAEGKIPVEGLRLGDYSFIETKAPTGYELDNTPVDFSITKEQKSAVQVSMTNKLTPGSVVLTKQDAASGEVLQGAVFELQDDTGTALQSALNTDAAGKISIDGLAPGKYQFVETQAPAGYELDNAPVTFTIVKGQKSALELTKKNQLTPGSVVLTKEDAASGDVLAGAIFELQDQQGNVLQNNLTTDAAGKIAIDGLAPGSYRFVETQAPTGYVLNSDPLLFTIVKGQSTATQLVATNELMQGSVVLTKKDATSGEPLPGAVFELQDKNGKVLQDKLVTDVAGKLSVDGLKPDDYQLVETQAPTGYQLDTKPVVFTIEKNQKDAVQVVKTNKLIPGGVLLEKIDEKTGAKLAGAEFELQNNNGKAIKGNLVTDSSGQLAIEGLAPDTYQLVETKAPAGYEIDKTPVTFTIDKGQKAAKKVTVTNRQKAHSVRVEKKDGDTKAFLAGAEFKLLDQAGEEVESALKTNESGTLEITGLTTGDYQLIETKAPEGYKLDSTPTLFTVKAEDELLTLAVYNYRTPGTTGTTGTPVTTGTSSQEQPSGNHNGQTPSAKKLSKRATYYPKTGEQSTIIPTMIGGIIVGLVLLMSLLWKKQTANKS